jgi:VIT1/CCC1 family predicted Fe2+/Mn2+ transporter
VALATFGGVLAAFGRVYWWALGVAVFAVAAAWGWVGWQSRRTGRRPARSTLRAMAGATALLCAAVSWPYIEPLVRRALRG